MTNVRNRYRRRVVVAVAVVCGAVISACGPAADDSSATLPVTPAATDVESLDADVAASVTDSWTTDSERCLEVVYPDRSLADGCVPLHFKPVRVFSLSSSVHPERTLHVFSLPPEFTGIEARFDDRQLDAKQYGFLFVGRTRPYAQPYRTDDITAASVLSVVVEAPDGRRWMCTEINIDVECARVDEP